LVVVMVSAALPPALLMTAPGLNEAVADAGNPPALRVTCWAVLPLVKAALMVADPDDPPCVAVIDAGAADSVKSFCATGLTISDNVVERLTEPVPVTVTE
jgi:hypothetical protein